MSLDGRVAANAAGWVTNVLLNRYSPPITWICNFWVCRAAASSSERRCRDACGL